MLTALAVGTATVALRLRDPHQPGSWGFCPTKLLTGLDCPGCGGLRAVNDLTHGDLAAAASSNLLLVTLVPVAVLLWVAWLRARWLDKDVLPDHWWRPAAMALAVATVAFAVARNLSGSWLAA